MRKTSIQGKLLRFMFIFLYNSAVSQSYKTTSFMENIQYKGDSITISLNYDNEGKFSNYSFKDSVYKQNFSFEKITKCDNAFFLVIKTVDNETTKCVSLCPQDTIVVVGYSMLYRYDRMPCILYLQKIDEN